MRKILYLLLFLSFGVSAQPAALYHSMLKTRASAPSPFQPETIAYMALVIASGATWDSTGYKAIDTLVRDLKGFTHPVYPTSNIWSKFIDILPFYGGTATAHSYNLVNPSLYAASFVGSPTHSASGVDLNGTSQHINTNLAQNLLTFSNNNVSLYASIDASAGNQYMFGTYDGGSGVFGFAKAISDYFVLGLWGGFATTGATPYRKFSAVDFSSASRVDLYGDGISRYNNTPISATSTQSIFIGGLNQGGSAVFRSLQTTKFFSAATSTLTSTENINFSTAVTAYQARLSRL